MLKNLRTLSKRKQQGLLIAAAIILAGLFACILHYDVRNAPGRYNSLAHSGLADATEYGSKLLSLSGTWEFYYGELLEKKDFLTNEHVPLVAPIPGVWNNLRTDDTDLPGFGCGTYRLKLRGMPAGKEVALYIPLLAVSYEVYADDMLVARNGRVSKSAEGFVPSFLPSTAFFTAQGNEVDIIVHISNFTYARAGMWHPIYLGTQAQIEHLNRLILYKEMFMLGSYMTLAIYYLSMYALRREQQSLLFVLMCVGAILRTMVNGDRAVVRLFSEFPFTLLIKFDYMAMLLFYPVMMFLMTQRFHKEFRKPVTWGFLWVGAASSFLILLLPVEVFTRYVLATDVFLFTSILYTLFMLFVAVLRFRKDAFPMFVAVLLLLFLTLRDLLYQSAIADNPLGEVSAFGFFMFLMLESFAISRDYADKFSQIQRLSMELMENDKLKDKVRQTEMAFLQSQIKPHFLYNSLSVIDEYCEIDPKEASRLIGSLAKYLRQSFDFENLENSVSIEKELALVRNYVDIESARFDDLKVECHAEYESDFFLPPLTIQPLVENAIRHGVRKKAGDGVVIIRISQVEAGIDVSVSDNGAGIPAETLSELLVDSDKRKSVGLLNIHNRLLRMYGQGLKIDSAVGAGTTVRFLVPTILKCENT